MRIQSLSRFFMVLAITVIAANVFAQEPKLEPQHLKFHSVPFTEVKIAEDAPIWGKRLEINRTVSIPHNIEWCEKTGRFTNFAKAARILNGNFEGIYFNDSDVYKLLEGIAYSLKVHPDPKLEKKADAVIEWIAAAQEPNGYINSYYQLREPEKKWTNTRVMHELYCGGHMVEAAVAYAQATGKKKLLDVAEKFMDHIMTVFGPEEGKRVEVPGHEEIELALVKLYQYTGKDKYFELARFFIDVRGDQSKRTDKLQGEYSQDHFPIRDHKEIYGHAVRAMYLYAGVADIAAYTGDEALIKAMDVLWNDVVNKKMYITAGIGARHEGEAFGNAFELPNKTAYCETCASIGLVFWAHRMNLLHGDSKYADVVERAIYNGVLSGIGYDGKSFFYVNPLASDGNHHRQPFFDCACCPTNVVRFVPSIPGYVYATEENGIVANLFIPGTATIELPDGKVEITLKTEYPFKDGALIYEIIPSPDEGIKAEAFSFKVRDPDWIMDTDKKQEIVASSIRFDKNVDKNIVENKKTYIPGSFATISVSGEIESKFSNNDPHERKNGYVCFDISWSKKTVITLDIGRNLPIRRIVANPKVVDDRGRVAVQRGPIVYCFEQCDNTVPVDRIILAKNPEFKEIFDENILDGVMVLKCKNVDGRELTAIPYFAWDSRKHGKMNLWVRQEGISRNPEYVEKDWTDEKTGEPILYRQLCEEMYSAVDEPIPFVETLSITASHCFGNDSLDSVLDNSEPKNSNDHAIPRMTFWNHKGTAEWIAVESEKPFDLSKCSVYWFDDTGRGECRIPKEAGVSYYDGSEWKKLDVKLGVEKDKFNTVEFPAVKAKGVRVDLQLQDGLSGGILSWKFE